jgi:cell division protein FtsL
MKNSTLCLLLVICIIICSINLYLITQLKREDGETENPIRSEESYLSEEISNHSFEEESTISECPISSESSEEVSVEDSSIDESNSSVFEDADKHLMSGATPDVITDLRVQLYNQHYPNYKEDAWIYFNDIHNYLLKYAPDGMWLSAAMAQAYTEGGAGKSGIYTRTNNCFGMMAGPNWDGYVYARSHGLVFKDYATAKRYGASGLFRAYRNIEESVKDYVELIQNERYASALSTSTPSSYLSVLLANGYGERHMINTWTQVINKFNLTQYDTQSK